MVPTVKPGVVLCSFDEGRKVNPSAGLDTFSVTERDRFSIRCRRIADVILVVELLDRLGSYTGELRRVTR